MASTPSNAIGELCGSKHTNASPAFCIRGVILQQNPTDGTFLPHTIKTDAWFEVGFELVETAKSAKPIAVCTYVSGKCVVFKQILLPASENTTRMRLVDATSGINFVIHVINSHLVALEEAFTVKATPLPIIRHNVFADLRTFAAGKWNLLSTASPDGVTAEMGELTRSHWNFK